MEYLMTFIMTFIIIMIIYYFCYVMYASRDKKCPTEATYLIRVYGLDINKFSYRKFLFHLAIVTSLDVAIVTTIVYSFDELIWQVLFGIVTIIPVIVVSFVITGKYYQKKQLKDNTKELIKEEKKLKKREKTKQRFLKFVGMFKRKKKGQNK